MAKKREGQSVMDQIREAIRGSGMSLNEISKLSKVSSSQLSRFMTGKRMLTLPVAERLLQALHLRLVVLPEEGSGRK
ncbi:MAG TPA: helix-turn-helix transcriptional regulator [Gemmataceae bacterium]|nr:helix-turn-helix transcriptional regulator [Gemmataceae bacterium]